VDDAKKQWEEFKGTLDGASLEFDEIALASMGLTDALDETANAVGQVTQAIDELGDATDTTNVVLERQKEILDELAERYKAATMTALEAELQAVTAMREELRTLKGGLTEEEAAQFDAILEVIRQKLREEGAAQVAADFKEALEAELQDIKFEGRHAQTSQEQLAVYAAEAEAVRATIRELEERLRLGVETVEEEEALVELILELSQALGQSTQAMDDLLDRIKAGNKDVIKDLQHTLLLIDQAARGAIQLAEAFGLVSEETSKTLNNLLQMGTGAATLAGGIASGNVGAIISGGLSFLGGLGGLFGGGPSPTEQAIEANTTAIFLLTDEMDKLAERMKEQRDDMEGMVAALRSNERAITHPRRASVTIGRRLSPAEFRELYRMVQAAGLSLPEGLVERAAKAAAKGQDVFIPEELARQYADFFQDILDQDLTPELEEGKTQDVTRSVSITEIQANELLAYQASQLEVLMDILAVLSRATPLVTAPEVAVPIPDPAAEPRTVSITIGPNEILLTGQDPQRDAEEFVDELLLRAGDRLAEQEILMGVRR
jgi:hypothetical protein